MRRSPESLAPVRKLDERPRSGGRELVELSFEFVQATARSKRIPVKHSTVDAEVDAIISAPWKTPVFVAAAAPPWLPTFEQDLPFRLPPSYRSLFLRYRFPAFHVGPITVFGNLSGQSYDDLVVASIRDRVVASVARANGFIQIGRPESGSYDPICFDASRRTKKGEAAIVQLDHEEILINNSIRVQEVTAASFLELLARGIRLIDP